MESKYVTLKIIYDLAKEHYDPVIYSCHPYQIIARQHLPWDQIKHDFELLEEEELIRLTKPGATIVCITEKGLERMEQIGKVVY